MDNENIRRIAEECRGEQQLSPLFPSDTLEQYVREGIYDIQKIVPKVDFNTDLTARALLKNYVRYAVYGKLADFKERYSFEYIGVQISYE